MSLRNTAWVWFVVLIFAAENSIAKDPPLPEFIPHAMIIRFRRQPRQGSRDTAPDNREYHQSAADQAIMSE